MRREVNKITARDGQIYSIECNTIEEGVYARIMADGWRVAYAHVSLRGDTAVLADIFVYDKIPSSNWILRTFFRKLSAKNFRNKGLGTLLLNSVCDYLRRSGIKSIAGKMCGDVKRLHRWYSKAGFSVDQTCKSITKNLI